MARPQPLMALAALLATSCCWVPLLLALLGLASAGWGARLEAAQPIFLVMTATFVAWSTYEAFGRGRVSDKPEQGACRDADCGVSSAPACSVRRARRFFFGHLALVALLLALPQLLPLLPRVEAAPLPSSGEHVDTGTTLSQVELSVDGMTCRGCVLGLERGLRTLTGVVRASVSLDPGYALVVYDSTLVDAEHILARVREEGYTPRLMVAEAP